eukprot:scaffold6834_cov83-Cylindrotheca_fusiformis.AAC.5
MMPLIGLLMGTRCGNVDPALHCTCVSCGQQVRDSEEEEGRSIMCIDSINRKATMYPIQAIVTKATMEEMVDLADPEQQSAKCLIIVEQ